MRMGRVATGRALRRISALVVIFGVLGANAPSGDAASTPKLIYLPYNNST